MGIGDGKMDRFLANNAVGAEDENGGHGPGRVFIAPGSSGGGGTWSTGPHGARIRHGIGRGCRGPRSRSANRPRPPSPSRSGCHREGAREGDRWALRGDASPFCLSLARGCWGSVPPGFVAASPPWTAGGGGDWWLRVAAGQRLASAGGAQGRAAGRWRRRPRHFRLYLVGSVFSSPSSSRFRLAKAIEVDPTGVRKPSGHHLPRPPRAAGNPPPSPAPLRTTMAEIEIKTAPADFRFPTTNQTRHCFTRYVEYHRCVNAKGDDAGDCDKFAKYYRSLCPGEWLTVC
uniref:Cytochrome c oxidase subunit 6b n=1 Tax=Setaria italica TaxID=4555 RepID=K3YUQ4_SETIT